jgi:hypothetical protein
MDPPVDRGSPATSPDPVYGTGARQEERLLAQLAGAGAAVFVVLSAWLDPSVRWSGWQYAVAGVLAFDLCGGVVANGLNSAKRYHFAPDPAPEASWLGRLVRRPVLFVSVHVQPLAVAVLFPGASWWWGAAWYVVTVSTVVLVSRVPLYLARPVALGVCVVTALVSPVVTSPAGFAWLPMVAVLKLTLAYAVREEPYRPQEVGAGG